MAKINLDDYNYRRVPVYNTNPWWYNMEGQVYVGNGSNSKLTVPKGHQKLLHTWCNGMTVPLFDLDFIGLGKDSDSVNVHRQYRDPVRKKDGRVYTEGEIIYQTREGSKFKYAGGNPFFSCDLPKTYRWENSGTRTSSGQDDQAVIRKTANYIQYNPRTGGDGAFQVTYPSGDSQGVDRIITYIWGDYDESPNAGVRNVCGMYWMQSNHSSDSNYYSWINRIIFIYQDAEGKRVNIMPYGGNAHTSGLSVNDDMRYPENYKLSAPGTAVNYDKDKARQRSAGVLRGAMLYPEQIRYVIDNQLVLTGMAVEVRKRTPSLPGSGNPHACFYNFFPWILGETSKFGQYYLHPMDYQVYKAEPGSTSRSNANYFSSLYYTESDIKLREEYFKAYDEQIEKQGGFKNGAIVDESGTFNKKIIIPPVTAWDDNSLGYTDNLSKIQSAEVTYWDLYNSPTMASNASKITPKPIGG